MNLSASINPNHEAAAKLALSTLTQRVDLGFLKLPYDTTTLKKANDWAAKLKKQGMTNLFVIGLGGSFLGTKAILSALNVITNVDFLFSLDKKVLDTHINKHKISTSHFLIVSKSGSTLETLSIANYVFHHLKQQNLDYSKHVSVITEDKPSPLKELSNKYSLHFIAHPIDVGGRFSIFSSVGIFPLEFAGIEVDMLLNGAKQAVNSPFTIQASAYFYEQLSLKKNISVFWPYNDRLFDFGLWLIQLWGESLTKKIQRSGEKPLSNTTPTLCIGTRDQHSLLQNFIEGDKQLHIVFFKEHLLHSTVCENYFPNIPALNHSLEAQLTASQQGTLQSLKESGIESALIEHPELTCKVMGEMMMAFELIIGTLGEMLNIDAYNQPGVERAKQICKEILTK